MQPAIDDSAFPIVRITFGRVMTLDEVEVHEQRMLAIFRARGPMLTIADLSAADFSANGPGVRRKLAESADRLSALGGFIAELVIVPSSLVRALFTAYTWIRQSKNHTVRAFASASAATLAAEQLLSQRLASAFAPPQRVPGEIDDNEHVHGQ